MNDAIDLQSAIRALTTVAEKTGSPINVGCEVEILAAYFGRKRAPEIREELIRQLRGKDITYVA